MKEKISLFLFLAVIATYSDFLEASIENKRDLAKIYYHYSNAEYDEAIKKIRKLKNDPRAFGVASYWEGKVYSKTQEYEKANISFKNALKKRVKTEDLFYLYGQSLYASQNLEVARKAFLTSAVRKNFKKAPSYYYVAIISELLEDNRKAKKYYKRILRLKTDNDKLKKPALFQIANLNYKNTLQTKNEHKLKTLIKETILPQFERAKLYKKEAPLTAKVIRRINEIKMKHKIGLPGKMINGRPIPKKLFSGSFSVGGKNDSNILSVSSEDPSLESASFTELSTSLRYQFNAKKTYSFIPGLSLSSKQHLNRNNPSIYQNDNLSIDPTFSFIWEQITFKKMSKAMVDVEYNHTMQDQNSIKKLVYYSKHLLLSIGYNFQPFSIGSTAFKYKFKIKEAYSTSLDSHTMTINLNQNFRLGKTSNLAVSLNADFNVYKESSSSDTDEYKFTFTPSFSKKLLWGIGLTPNYSFTVTNNVFDSIKGVETSHDTGLTMTKAWANLSTNVNYSFTKKISKDASSSYSKHIMGLGLTYNL